MEDKPTTPQYSLSDLLAYRDAEPLDEEIWRSIANDPHAQQQLARLGELKTQLKNLPLRKRWACINSISREPDTTIFGFGTKSSVGSRRS